MIFQYAYTYDQQVIGYGGGPRDVVAALGKKFNYIELMGG